MNLLDFMKIEKDPHRFDGTTYQPELDFIRLTGQLQAIYNLMRSGSWYSVTNIHEALGFPEPSISAQIRNLRKKKFGGHLIERRRVDNFYQFRLLK